MWQCNRFPKWLQKTYHIEGVDFCEGHWNDEYINSQPSCDDVVLPTIVFYDKDDDERVPLCKVNMNYATDGDLTKYCPSLITALSVDNEGIFENIQFYLTKNILYHSV